LPGHGAGSPCGKKISNAFCSSIGKEMNDNYSLKIDNKDEFY